MNLFGEQNEEALGQARLAIWQSFEDIDEMFENLGEGLSNPAYMKAFLKSLMKRIVAEANISDLLVHKPEGSFALLYPLKECVDVVREELVRSVEKDVGELTNGTA